MAGTFITSQRRKVYVEDVAGGVSVSESFGSKLGATVNFILERVVQKIQFGAGGGITIDSLVMPFTFSANSEFMVENVLLQRIRVNMQITGSAGQTEFYIERRPVGSGTWTNILSTNCIINNTASDNLFFQSDGSAPLGVTLPIINLSSFNTNDELRLVLLSAATGANNLQIFLEVSPA